ncbi:MAG: hypothetical protein V4477_03875 [Pseudomonadota bacterium]
MPPTARFGRRDVDEGDTLGLRCDGGRQACAADLYQIGADIFDGARTGCDLHPFDAAGNFCEPFFKQPVLAEHEKSGIVGVNANAKNKRHWDSPDSSTFISNYTSSRFFGRSRISDGLSKFFDELHFHTGDSDGCNDATSAGTRV